MNDTYLIKHERCPACAKLGNDNGHDNLGIYSDGHQWCFRCGYHVSGNRIASYKAKHSGVQGTTQPEWNGIRLPFDCDPAIPSQAIQWLKQYEFTNATITKHNILWSESRQFLVFPYFIMGELVGWQGRYFGPDKIGKWNTNGKPESYIYTLGPTSKRIILSESIISAIKISRFECSSPLFGSVISNSRLIRLANFYTDVVIWLDPDKQREAIKFAQKAKLFGMDSHVILSDMKPKDYTYTQIEEMLNASTRTGTTPHPT